MKIFIHTVNSEQLALDWLAMPGKIYEKLPNKPLMPADDVKKVFDPASNSLLHKGKVSRWLAYDQYNLCAGRIAAFYLPGAATGQMGFFESTQDEKVAHELFAAAATWLTSGGCRYMEGPVNIGEKDRFWGLMTQGYETKGLYLDNFNPSYYQPFFKSFGFVTRDIIYTYQLQYETFPADKLNTIARWSEQKFGYRLRHFAWVEKDQLVTDIHSIYKASFKEEKRMAHLSLDDVSGLFDQVKPLLNEKYCWLAYQGNLPLGFILFLQEPLIPSGQKKQAGIQKGFAFATIPAMRGKGLEISLSMAIYQQVTRDERKYEVMVSGINAGTTKMNSLIRKIGGQKVKEHQTFTYKLNI